MENLQAQNAEELEALRIKYLSKKGEINALMGDFRNVAAESKREVGKYLNELKESAQNKINELKTCFDAAGDSADLVDLTRTAYPIALGTRHPLSIVRGEICDIFARLGFSIAEGPEVEDDWHVFSALNFAEDHPARDMQDTFFIQHHPDVLLRTHTSSVQVRVMERQQPPVRIICPGRVYRNEAVSARAHCFFHQVEALYVDRQVSFADLKQVLLFFARELFGAGTEIRLRRGGLRSSAVAWSTRTCSIAAASTATRTPVSPSVWASSALPCSSIASTTSDSSSRTTCASSASSPWPNDQEGALPRRHRLV